jgi:hypothetical protein
MLGYSTAKLCDGMLPNVAGKELGLASKGILQPSMLLGDERVHDESSYFWE